MHRGTDADGERRRNPSGERRSHRGQGSDGREGDQTGRKRSQRRKTDDGPSERGRGERGSGSRGRQRRRNDRGQYVETVEADDVLALLDRIPGPVITTTDVAETFDITTEGARRKLNDLCDAGLLDRRKTGRTRVYWRIEAPE